jgi:hypothetical protein
VSSGRKPPFIKDLNMEAQEYQLLEAVTRKRLVKTLQAGKDLACARVIFKVWKSVMVL